MTACGFGNAGGYGDFGNEVAMAGNQVGMSGNQVVVDVDGPTGDNEIVVLETTGSSTGARVSGMAPVMSAPVMGAPMGASMGLPVMGASMGAPVVGASMGVPAMGASMGAPVMGASMGGSGTVLSGVSRMSDCAPCATTLPAAATNTADADCEDCVQLVATTKRVQVPCTRNEYRQYTVKVPRQVTEQVPRTVQYTDMVTKDKVVTYTANRTETRYRDEQQCYTVNVPCKKTRMVTVTKKVPKTVYVDVTEQVPQEYTDMVAEQRTKSVRIPYQVTVPETRCRTVQEQVPVTKTRTEYDNVTRTVYDTQTRTRCVPVTKMITKEIPVYNVVPKPPSAPCDTGDCGQVVPEPQPKPQVVVVKTKYSAPERYDTNNDGVLDEGEREKAMRDGQLRVDDRQVVASTMSGGNNAVRANAGAGAAGAMQARTQEYSAPAKYDADGDGKLDAAEMAQAARDGQLRAEGGAAAGGAAAGGMGGQRPPAGYGGAGYGAGGAGYGGYGAGGGGYGYGGAAPPAGYGGGGYGQQAAYNASSSRYGGSSYRKPRTSRSSRSSSKKRSSKSRSSSSRRRRY